MLEDSKTCKRGATKEQRWNDRTNVKSSPNQSPPRYSPRRGRRKGLKNLKNNEQIRNFVRTAVPPLNMCLALDCEMVGVGPRGTESVLARVTVVNSSYEVVMDTFVRALVPVTDYRTFVSGVRAEDIESDKAVTPEECREKVRAILRGKILVGHGLENDLRALGITHPWKDIRDTATYGPYMRVRGGSNGYVFSPKKLRDLAWDELGTQIQVMGRPHSPVEDAVAALDLYKAARLEWEQAIELHRRRAAAEMELWRMHMVANNTFTRPPHSPATACGYYIQQNKVTGLIREGDLNRPIMYKHKGQFSTTYQHQKSLHAVMDPPYHQGPLSTAPIRFAVAKQPFYPQGIISA